MNIFKVKPHFPPDGPYSLQTEVTQNLPYDSKIIQVTGSPNLNCGLGSLKPIDLHLCNR